MRSSYQSTKFSAYDPYADFVSFDAPNGLKIYASYRENCPWEAVGFIVHVGSESDPSELRGLSHFVEHLVPKNTTLPKNRINDWFDNFGGNAYLGGTGYFDTEYKFFVPIGNNKVVEKAFTIFGEMLLSSRIEKSIESERDVIISEFYRTYPSGATWEEGRIKYKDLELEKFSSIIGDAKSIRRITRSDLQFHYDAWYTPANISIVCLVAYAQANSSDFSITVRLP
jgi:predicted Zn-dependent peptidase